MSDQVTPHPRLEALVKQLRERQIDVDSSVRRTWEYSYDASNYRIRPAAVSFPRTVGEVREILRQCALHHVPLTPTCRAALPSTWVALKSSPLVGVERGRSQERPRSSHQEGGHGRAVVSRGNARGVVGCSQ